MSGSAVHTTRFAEPDSLSANAAIFADARDDVFQSLEWYRVVLSYGMSSGAVARFMTCRHGGVFPMQTMNGDFMSLTTLYTCRYQPLATAEDDFAEFAKACRAWPTTRLDALPEDWPQLARCVDAARSAGLAVRRFNHFGNWHEVVRGQTWKSYLAERPGQLRETIRRKLRRTPDFDLVTGGDRLEPGIAAFEDVYRRSWKEPEPFPDFNAGLMRAVAPLGMLRLGILRDGDTPMAAQLWIMERERATVLKLAHDEAFKAASPGTVLTALMLQRLLDEEQVPEIDFGRGDDPYKSAWARQRRQRIGLILANPRRPRGMVFLGRHALGRARAALRR